MDFQFISVCVATALCISISIFITRRWRTSEMVEATRDLDHSVPLKGSPEPSELVKSLSSALPRSVIMPQEAAAFERSTKCYWAQQESERSPACIVQPQDVQQLSTAVTILNHEFDAQQKQVTGKKTEGLFAIRGGGHSAVSGAASSEGGVLIDLVHFNEVTPSEDGSSVTIGAGAKWMDVSTALDQKGLAAIGGRNSHVGVGGLTLGGGLSFFSPRFGLVCSNVISYEIVLASGLLTTASASTNSDLWRALKGGANNFGIVTSFTVRSFPSTKIWSGFLYMPSFNAAKVLAAFHESVNRADPSHAGPLHDSHAAGPLACFTYLQTLGIQAISVNLVYTRPPESENKWPSYWSTSSFASLWRFWSTCRLRTLTSATDELNALNPPGRRQVLAATTIKNDAATLDVAHAAYRNAIASIRRVKGISWTLVLQPLVPDWACKGDPNPLGLGDSTGDPLVIVSLTVNWDSAKDDAFVKAATRRALEEIEAFAGAHGTGHRYRYLNYCAEWQRPFKGYGEENWWFLREVSKKYDPEGLFQKGCTGGFKLGIKAER